MSNRAATWLALSLRVLVVMTLVFVPDAIRIVYAFITNFQSRGLDVLSDYSAVSMAFFLVVCLAATICSRPAVNQACQAALQASLRGLSRSR